jgi:hypothetical protein
MQSSLFAERDASVGAALLLDRVEMKLSGRIAEEALENLFRLLESYRAQGLARLQDHRGVERLRGAMDGAIAAAFPGASVDEACGALTETLRIIEADDVPPDEARRRLHRFLQALRGNLN